MKNLLLLIAVVVVLTGCGGSASLNPFDWFGGPPTVDSGQSKPPTYGETQLYGNVGWMVGAAFVPGVLCLMLGTWIKPLWDTGITLVVVGIGIVLGFLMFELAAVWLTAIVAATAVGAVGIWLYHRWTDRRWLKTARNRKTALELEAEHATDDTDKAACLRAAEEIERLMET